MLIGPTQRWRRFVEPFARRLCGVAVSQSTYLFIKQKHLNCLQHEAKLPKEDAE